MIILKATTEILEITTDFAADIDYSISYADISATTFLPSSNEGKIITATTVTVLPAPAASTQRQVKLITITNRHASTTNTVRVKKDISGTEYYLTPASNLLAGETMQYIDGQGWKFYTSNGSLKIDGTIAAGSNMQVQYNDNGILAGASGLVYDSINNFLGLAAADSSLHLPTGIDNPVLPPANTLAIFGRAIAGRAMVAQVGSSGLDTSLQPLMARNKVGYWNPPGGATTVPGVFGITALTANGTATSRTVTTTNLANRMRRIGYPSSATAGTFAGARLPVTQFTCGSGTNDGSGFMLIERWVESDPAFVNGRRAFHGMTNSTAAMTNVEINTLTYKVGICQLSTDSTRWYWYNAGSSVGTPVAIGTTIGAPGGNSTTAWELAIFAPMGIANTYYLELTNITTGLKETRTITGGAATAIPQSTVLLAWNSWATNNATALAVGIDLCSLYVETDN